MMVRLLQLKKAIQEYFRTHDGNARKLTTREWTIANEVCSLLDVVAEVTIKIQGGVDTHISQTMFSMLEIKERYATPSSRGWSRRGLGRPACPWNASARSWTPGGRTARKSISSTAAQL